ncbi:phosphotransferase [Natronosalvus rutilus]|uniref:Phosphotransferase n=1 Tax=Natronosalvus rutilus TaxID=2953753 RepID=A0A9E7SVF7_9EURY|nr:phosphotransferase [Natronosalvus rutilus]UTF52961.1 phosphotransferase [Natronosalvus rutilus]
MVDDVLLNLESATGVFETTEDASSPVPTRGRDTTQSSANALIDVKRDAWLALAADVIDGPCLAVGPGSARRAISLASFAERLCVVDSSEFGRPASTNHAREPHSNRGPSLADRIVHVRAREDRLPFSAGAFESIVADLTGADDVRARLEKLVDQLTDTGNLTFVADGFVGRSGLASMAGFGKPTEPSASLAGRLYGTANWYRSAAAALGFDEVTVYACVPTASNPAYVVAVDDERAVYRMSSFVLAEFERWGDLGERVLSTIRSSESAASLYPALLERLYPSFVVVCTNESSAPNVLGTPLENGVEPLLLSGRARSVVLELGEQGIRRVWKIPNCRANAALTAREHTLLTWLQSQDTPLRGTFPDGTAVETPFGTARIEEPVGGTPLIERLEGDPETFGSVLQTGRNWLVEFQRTFRGDRVVRSPDAVREELRFEPTGIEPPSISDPVPTFTTPVHGDFMPSNVHVHDDESIAGVIDWEYGTVAGSPIIDAGLFLLDAANRAFGSYPAGFEAVLCDSSVRPSAAKPFVEHAREYVSSYCDALDIPERTFGIYLPSVYLHRLALDWRYGTTSHYSEKRVNRSKFVIDLFEARDSMWLECEEVAQ